MKKQTWHNGASTAKKILYPGSLKEVITIIKQANHNNTPIRFLGSRHSWHELISTPGYLVTTDAFNKILSIDHNTHQVHVEGGIKIHDLIKQLAKHGLALPTQGFITAQSIAGAISTGTHGSGHVATLSDYVIGMNIIDAQGTMHTLIQEDHPEILAAARINLGALGFVYSLTLQCVPLFVLKHRRTMIKLHELIPKYMHFLTHHDFFQFMWHPMSEDALVFHWQHTEEQPTNNFFTKLAENVLYSKIMNYFSIPTARLFPRLMSSSLHTILKRLQMPEHRDYSYKTLSPLKNPHPVKHYREGDIAIPLENFAQAFQETKELYQKYQVLWPTLVGVVMNRFVKGSTASLLSPSYGRNSAYISIAILSKFPDYKNFFFEWQHGMLKYQGRPHWGKINILNKELVNQLYGENAQKFNQIRKQFDPQGIFSNEFVQNCF